MWRVERTRHQQCPVTQNGNWNELELKTNRDVRPSLCEVSERLSANQLSGRRVALAPAFSRQRPVFWCGGHLWLDFHSVRHINDRHRNKIRSRLRAASLNRVEFINFFSFWLRRVQKFHGSGVANFLQIPRTLIVDFFSNKLVDLIHVSVGGWLI